MKNKNMNKRKLQGVKTKKRIFEMARELALEYDIENVTVDSIVKAVGISKGAFYVHFKSKDELVADLINEYTNTADMDYKSFMETLPLDIPSLEMLMLLAENISDFLSEEIGYKNIRLLYKTHLSNAIDSSSAMSYNRQLYKLFTEVLERGVKHEEFREDISVDSLAKHLILAIRGVAFEWCIRYPDFDLSDQVSDHFKIILYGLKK